MGVGDSGSARSGTPTRPVSPQEMLGPLTALELKYAPPVLYLAGATRLPLRHPRVAVVGTRQPSAEGRAAATALSRTLAEQGVTVISGLARGVDTAAHRAAMDAGGHTVAVLGTPLSRVHPPSNAELQRRIMAEHLAVSQFADGAPVRPANFRVRNRTIALIADASVILESGDTGGSLSVGWEALRLGRPLFVPDREFTRSSQTWPDRLARYGAVRFRAPSDILEWLPSAVPSPETSLLALRAA